MKTAIVTFQGFTESLGTSSGTELLWQLLRPLSSEDVLVTAPAAWDSRTDRAAAFLQRQQIERVVIVGYSWGAGYASQRFARECGKRGLAVPLMLLCDPVYRPLWLPPLLPLLPLAFRALIPGGAAIRIPRNVRRVAWVRQTLSVPMGHPLDADPYATAVENCHLLPYGHTAIDASPEWHDLATSKIREFLES